MSTFLWIAIISFSVLIYAVIGAFVWGYSEGKLGYDDEAVPAALFWPVWLIYKVLIVTICKILIFTFRRPVLWVGRVFEGVYELAKNGRPEKVKIPKAKVHVK